MFYSEVSSSCVSFMCGTLVILVEPMHHFNQNCDIFERNIVKKKAKKKLKQREKKSLQRAILSWFDF